jgi:WhiB family redox-sensing transcriptional regulator
VSGQRVTLEGAPFPGSWRNDGACREVPPAIFFPGRGEEATAARAVCTACPVVEECRSYALGVAGLKGVWGGLSEHDRTDLRRQADEAVAVVQSAPPHAPGPASAPAGTLLAHLEELVHYEGQWAQVGRFASAHSASAMASLLRHRRRAVPPGRWCFEGYVDDQGGSELWARYQGLEDGPGLDETLAG